MGYEEFHTVSKGISLKLNIIVPLDFEATHYDVAVQDVNPYTTTLNKN